MSQDNGHSSDTVTISPLNINMSEVEYKRFLDDFENLGSQIRNSVAELENLSDNVNRYCHASDNGRKFSDERILEVVREFRDTDDSPVADYLYVESDEMLSTNDNFTPITIHGTYSQAVCKLMEYVIAHDIPFTKDLDHNLQFKCQECKVDDLSNDLIYQQIVDMIDCNNMLVK